MSTTKKGSDGFSEAERAAMRERAQELKAQGRKGEKKVENEQAVLNAIAEMPDADRTIAERIHALVAANAPGLLPKTWYGMPAYATDEGKVVCFFKAAAKSVEEWLPKVSGVVDIINQTIVIGPAINFRVDPEKAQRAGFSVADVANLEAAVLDGQLASTMIRGDRQIGIRVRYPAEQRNSADQLQTLLLTSQTGTTVPLSSIAHVEMQEGQTEIHRENLRNLSAVTARLERRDLGSAMAEIQQRLPKEVHLPPGVDIEYGGLYQIQRESFLGLTQVLLMSIVLIFIILVFEFRSFAHPFAILLATVLCTFGSLLALLVTGETLNIASFMGVIMFFMSPWQVEQSTPAFT
jgi:Cu/Ag efflux pump CusA